MSLDFSAVVLAAGKGVRMKSELPKVLHKVAGKPMIDYVLSSVYALNPQKIYVIVGFGKDKIIEHLSKTNYFRKLSFITQEPQLGTGHAIQCLFHNENLKEVSQNLLILCGDTPLISLETLKNLLNTHVTSNPAVTMLTLKLDNPGSYGRIIRNSKGNVIAIREAKDCSPEEKEIKEINLSIYVFNTYLLHSQIYNITNNNNQKEFYLTDVIELLAKANNKIISIEEKDPHSTLGINNRFDLSLISRIIVNKKIYELMNEGVTIIDPNQTWIEPNVKISSDTTIHPFTTITGETIIGKNCEIGPNTYIEDSIIGDEVTIIQSSIINSKVPNKSNIKPFTSILNNRDY